MDEDIRKAVEILRNSGTNNVPHTAIMTTRTYIELLITGYMEEPSPKGFKILVDKLLDLVPSEEDL